MKPPSLLILADRGHLLAFTVDRSWRAPSPRSVVSAEIPLGNQISEQVTDKAGSCPVNSDCHSNAAGERMTLVAELEMRAFRRVAARIATLLQQHHADTWGFAAPSEINGAILESLDPSWRDCLAENLSRDLTHIPRGELLEHFERGRGCA